MNYTEIDNEPATDLSFLSRLLMIRDATLPDVEPLPDDPALVVLEDAKKRYLDCVLKISNALSCIQRKETTLETIIALVKKIDDPDPYKEYLDAIIEKFETTEGLLYSRKILNEYVAEYKSLRKVFELVDDPNKFLCFTCLAKTIDHVFIPCGHTICADCVQRMSNISSCPFCRSPVKNTFKLFLG
jgi:hypothetical protein